MNYREKLLDLKHRIRLKFKTLRHFCFSIGMEYSEINKFFAQRINPNRADEMFKELERLLYQTSPKVNDDEIKKEDREYIRAKIMINYRSVEKFIVDNPSYSKSFISNVINGRRVRNDMRYKRLKEVVDSLGSMEQIKG
jgi:hypothetical protein